LAKRISLALVIHNHQPVGNFGWVIEEMYEKSYEPMVGALERHPQVRVALHYTGPLLEWLSAEQPEFIERLRALVGRDQVEILGGGLFEPILVSLPQRDRAGQLERMRATIGELFGATPRGAWLAERVWEPSLPFDLAAAGYEYTVLDDTHLRGAFVPEHQMWGTYTTDDQGKLLTIFGTEQGLRYRIPWRPVDELIEYLRDNATEGGDRVGIMGDDGEKFGGWPGTHELCWSKEAWVDRCFAALAHNSDWLTTVTPAQWMAEHPPQGRIYIPTSSYAEMTEWALPADEQPIFHRALEEARQGDEPELRFMRGALWRNFQARYREINDLHKQMLRVSAAVEAMPSGRERERALDHLYRGQSNDCYWHGWFGGIYIVHMRMATHAELSAAEDLALGDAALAGVADYDLDGVDEVALGTVGQSVIVDLSEGAGIGAWDLRATRVALASVLRRRPEPYHAQILEAAAGRAVAELAAGSGPADSDENAAQLSKVIVYDDHERRSGLVRLRDAAGRQIGAFERDAWTLDESDVTWLAASRAHDGLVVRKEMGLRGGRLDGQLWLKVSVRAETAFSGTLELEWNLNLLGGGGNPQAYYRSDGDEWRHDVVGSVAADAQLSFGNAYEGVDISLSTDPPAPASWYPVETVSNSESGFEKVYQGSCLVQRWPLSLAAGETASFATMLSFTQSRDRAAEEASA
jgi:alpha-amylase